MGGREEGKGRGGGGWEGGREGGGEGGRKRERRWKATSGSLSIQTTDNCPDVQTQKTGSWCFCDSLDDLVEAGGKLGVVVVDTVPGGRVELEALHVGRP